MSGLSRRGRRRLESKFKVRCREYLSSQTRSGAVLISLDLERNRIGAKGAKAIAAALSSAVLTDLNLRFNSLGAAVAKAIAEALGSGRAALKTLDLAANDIGPKGAKALATALGSGKEVTRLGLGHLMMAETRRRKRC